MSVSDFNKNFLSILSHVLSVPDYSTYNKTYLRTVFRIGARVVRGKDWSYGSQDDFGVGTIISNFTASLLVRVRWDSGRIFPYRMGYSSKYDLYLVQGALKIISEFVLEVLLCCTYVKDNACVDTASDSLETIWLSRKTRFLLLWYFFISRNPYRNQLSSSAKHPLWFCHHNRLEAIWRCLLWLQEWLCTARISNANMCWWLLDWKSARLSQ